MLQQGQRISTPAPAVAAVRRRWELVTPKTDPDALAQALDVPPIVGRLLANRGVGEGGIDHWLNPSLRHLPDPRTLTDMSAAVERVLQALDGEERIVIHGDYDVDGCTSTALLVRFLGGLGADVHWYAPHRIRDGYGIQVATMERLAEEGACLVITCDNGTSAHAAIGRGNELGVDTVVVDHHRLPETLPDAAAILNPKRDGAGNPFEMMAAVGVAFMLAIAVRAALRERGAFAVRPEPDLREHLEVVALGTVADLAPLNGVNRTLVAAGLRLLQHRRHPGLNALLEVAGVDADEPVRAYHLGFQLGPRINAAGRLDEASLAVRLLLETDRHAAKAMAEELHAINKRRQELERDVFDDSLEQVAEHIDLSKPGGLVLWSADWHPGVIGIVASRVMRHFHRPALLLAVRDGKATGSGRAISGIDLFDSLNRLSHLFVRFGGHRAAAGVTLLEENLPALREAFANGAFADLPEEKWEPVLRLDAEIDVQDVNWGLHEILTRLAPFGLGNIEPSFLARGLRATGVKQLAGGRGVRMLLRGADGPSVAAIGWGLNLADDVLDGPIDVAFSLSVNHWRGRVSLEMRLKDVRPAS